MVIRRPRMRRAVCQARKQDKADSCLLHRAEEVLSGVEEELVRSGEWPGDLTGALKG